MVSTVEYIDKLYPIPVAISIGKGKRIYKSREQKE
jgi:hypothetical protein